MCNPSRFRYVISILVNRLVKRYVFLGLYMKAKIDWGYIPQSNQYTLPLLFSNPSFFNPFVVASCVSTAFEGVLSGLPISEQPLLSKLWQGPSGVCCSMFLRFSTSTGQSGRRRDIIGDDRCDLRFLVLSCIDQICINILFSDSVGDEGFIIG